MRGSKGNLFSWHHFITFFFTSFLFYFLVFFTWALTILFHFYVLLLKRLDTNLQESTLCSCIEMNTCVRSWPIKSVNEVWMKKAGLWPVQNDFLCGRKRSYVPWILLFQIKSVLKWFTKYLHTYTKWSASDMKKISHKFPGGALTVIYFLVMFLSA